MFSQTIQHLIDRGRNGLGSKRFLHILGVTHTVNTLAARHGLGLESASLAGLLHDVSKQIEPDDIEHDLLRRGVQIPHDDVHYPRTWHGLHASVVASQDLGLTQADVLEAVRLHTTCDANVGPLTRALYIADFIEPCRNLESSGDLLQTALRDLDEGFRETLKIKTHHVLVHHKHARLHPRAQRCVRAWLEPQYWTQFGLDEV